MKKQLKILLVAALAVATVLSLSACGSGAQGNSSTWPTYVVAMEPTFPPFDTTDEKDSKQLAGADYDMMEAIAKDQGFKLEWKNMSFDGLIPAVKSGNIDIIASGMADTKDREKEVLFSDTYYDSGLVVAVKEDNNTIKGKDDFTKDMIIGAQTGTTSSDMIQALAKKGKIKQAKIYNGLNEAVTDLTNGTIDALVNDKPVTENYIAKKPNTIKIVGDTLDAEHFAFAVKKDNTELCDKINKGLKNIKDDGTFDKIMKDWKLGTD
ncbi:MAG: basic amino acid ABC transporter substrate-binding protein [Eubacteriaceae bacterium]|jgi:polar amino acid transport system substrate-binding protein|nr:basic amino acid ABC transporter substrate-binding protein [Eubacteriaceae bacterium]